VNGRLPRVEVDDVWPPAAMVSLPAAVRDRFGVDVRCVRHVPCDDEIVVEVEAAGDPPATWAACDEPAFASWSASRWADDRAPWERSGWFLGAAATFVDALADLGISVVEGPACIKGCWPCSAVLSAGTDRGRFFWKAFSPKPPREPATLRALHALGIKGIPTLVSCGPDDDWMITADFGTDTVTDHEGALRRFAELQLVVGDSLAAQLPDFTPAVLATRFSTYPRVVDACSELAASPIGAGLVHQDFRAGNVAAPCTFFDWSDVVRSHPFFSGIRYLDLFSQAEPEHRWNELHDLTASPPRFVELRDAYLAPFADAFGRGRALRDFDVAWSLQGAFMSVRWDWEQSHLEHGAPWSSWLRRFATNEIAMRLETRLGHAHA